MSEGRHDKLKLHARKMDAAQSCEGDVRAVRIYVLQMTPDNELFLKLSHGNSAEGGCAHRHKAEDTKRYPRNKETEQNRINAKKS